MFTNFPSQILPSHEKLKSRVNAIMKKGFQEGKIIGACVGIYQKQAECLFEAYGLADKETAIEMQTNALFRIFSMTKPVTAVATMMLWEQGKLELSDPIHWYLPTFAHKQAEENGVLVPANRDITIQDLLNMTSGIPYPDSQCVSQRCMGELYDTINQRLSTNHPIGTQEYAMLVGKDVPLMFQPGTKWSYGASADVLGAILECVSDKPLDCFFRENIFEPLGMHDTDFYVPMGKRERLAQLYAWNNEKGTLVVEPDPHLGMTDYRKRPDFFSGGAGLISTLHDYAQFANMLAGKGFHAASGTQLIGTQTWRYLTTPQLSETQKAGMDWPQLAGYTYGNLLRVLENPADCFTNVPAGEFGWDGWTGPYFCVSPEDETVLIYMTQVCGGSTSDIVRRLRTTTFGTLSTH